MYEIFINGEWVQSETEPQPGQRYRTTDGGGGQIESIWPQPEPTPTTYQTANESVKINGNAPLPKATLYAATLGDDVTVIADTVDDQGTLQTQLDQVTMGLPEVLFLPFQKFSGGVNGTVLDEVYFTTTLVAGVFTIHGTFPSAGNWIMTEERMNQAIESIGAGFRIESGDLNIMMRVP